MQPLKVFTGWDDREAVGWHVFASSAIRNSSVPLQITPLRGLLKRQGSNAFTFSRYAVPYLCDFKGKALFLDGADMLVKGDLAELLDLLELDKAVACVKHRYKSRHVRKYVGTSMESPNIMYQAKNWSSCMVFNCAFEAHKRLTPDRLEIMGGLHQFAWLEPDRVQELDPIWNWLADEFGYNEDAKILHWTAGIPAFKHYRSSPHADEWRRELADLTSVPVDNFDPSPEVSER